MTHSALVSVKDATARVFTRTFNRKDGTGQTDPMGVIKIFVGRGILFVKTFFLKSEGPGQTVGEEVAASFKLFQAILEKGGAARGDFQISCPTGMHRQFRDGMNEIGAQAITGTLSNNTVTLDPDEMTAAAQRAAELGLEKHIQPQNSNSDDQDTNQAASPEPPDYSEAPVC